MSWIHSQSTKLTGQDGNGPRITVQAKGMRRRMTLDPCLSTRSLQQKLQILGMLLGTQGLQCINIAHIPSDSISKLSTKRSGCGRFQ